MAAQKKKTNAAGKRKGTRSKKKQNHYGKEISGFILIVIGLLGLFQLGFVGTFFYTVGELILGSLSLALLLGMIICGGYLLIKRTAPHFFAKRLVGIYLIAIGLAVLLHMSLMLKALPADQTILGFSNHLAFQNILHPEQIASVGGGMIGAVITAITYFLISAVGTNIFALFLVVFGLSLASGVPLSVVWEKLRAVYANWREKARLAKEKAELRKAKQELKKQEKEQAKVESDNNVKEPVEKVVKEEKENKPPIISNFNAAKKEENTTKETARNASQQAEGEEEAIQEMRFEQESFENEIYQLPPLSLLNEAKSVDQSKEYQQIEANARKLEETFDSFGVKAKITQVHLGPAVTKYEVQPAVGVKVSRIVSLSDDIALALAAKDIRIEAPIPGKSAIGIEVANQQVAMVTLREVLENNSQNHPEDKLQIALGRDISGDAVLAHLNKMPHLLVAGSTGSGKSVCINGIITSILLRAKPHEVKMMMIDPKMVELNVYNGIPHLLAPVVTNPKKAAQALQKIVAEMERRYDLFSHTGTRNMEGYNEQVRKHNEKNEEKQAELPYIVVIVDELADLMMVASNDVEDAITRLAQMARAAGIHLIIATQRPSVDVITGVIKANIPSRIAFAVSSATDSRTILDMGGAEKLLGRGDMLFLPVGSSKPTRVQGAFLSDEEVENIVDFTISQQKAQYDEEMIPDDIPEHTEEAEDELYDEAVALVVEMQTASVSMLQRKFRIGYNRAARLIDEMEQRGVVGPHEGSKPRRVNVESLGDSDMED
ncbi:FtsK/SpoIIIE family DNA translocase [Listeria valentina]|uniref:FtsK/SpoIIIE family DNA translocase n=1 Tax=Listeria valentina TaxID=2705293 RepID=UPI001FE7E851|nr:DNA translocase FtsK [Listeria valentina]